MPDPASGSPAVTGASRRWPWTRPSTCSLSHPGQQAQVRVRPPARDDAPGPPLYSAVSFPADCGFVAGTEGADGEPLDALVLPEDRPSRAAGSGRGSSGCSGSDTTRRVRAAVRPRSSPWPRATPASRRSRTWTSSPSTCCANGELLRRLQDARARHVPGARRLRGPPGRPPRDRGGPGPRQAVRAQVIRVSPAPSASPGRAPWLLGCSAVHSV